ncbi:hypothetical protein SVIOM74S_08982 [Streptomyces violarus]
MEQRWNWYTGLGLREENMRWYEHPKEKLSHYSKRTADIEYRFQFGGSEWGELEGVANRTDYDLGAHSKASGQDLTYFDQEAGEVGIVYTLAAALSGAGARASSRPSGARSGSCRICWPRSPGSPPCCTPARPPSRC